MTAEKRTWDSPGMDKHELKTSLVNVHQQNFYYRPPNLNHYSSWCSEILTSSSVMAETSVSLRIAVGNSPLGVRKGVTMIFKHSRSIALIWAFDIVCPLISLIVHEQLVKFDKIWRNSFLNLVLLTNFNVSRIVFGLCFWTRGRPLEIKRFYLNLFI